tara:strand:+ start:41 stop:646 length:606 start_codon:yes stop_codon:yes gene_type:complete
MSIIKLNNRAVKDATAVGSITGLGNLVFISRSTASSSSSLSITSGIDSTYKEYIFMLNNIHPQTDAVTFQFGLSSDGGSNYNVTKTSTDILTYSNEAGSTASLHGTGGYQQAQSTSYQAINENTGADNDQGHSGFLHLFDPSNTTFVKHFIMSFQTLHRSDYVWTTFIGGYANTTSAINAIDFKMSSGNIDSGTIDLYGVK